MKLADIQIALGKNQKNLIKAERRPHISFSITNELSGPILIEVPPLTITSPIGSWVLACHTILMHCLKENVN